MNDSEFNERLDEASQRVWRMDRIDGWKDRCPSTILAALEAGLRKPETGAHFDAYVMLEDFVKWIREQANA